jgi:hypothetical protein
VNKHRCCHSLIGLAKNFKQAILDSKRRQQC